MTSSIQSGATAPGGRARGHSSKSAPFARGLQGGAAPLHRFHEGLQGRRRGPHDGALQALDESGPALPLRRGELGLTFVAPARVPLMGAIAKNAV